jgi:DNA-damage-inducible protein D
VEVLALLTYDAYIVGLEAVKRVSSDGVEYWTARDIQKVLGYKTWDKFEAVIKRAMDAARSGGAVPLNHFSRSGNMVRIGSGALRQQEDYYLTRGACYLVAMNGDPKKEEIGHAMIYFAAQTRRQELLQKALEDGERITKRLQLLENNRTLSGVAHAKGVRSDRQAVFKSGGYRGLYGMNLTDVKRYKNIPDSEDLLDCIGQVELSANDLVATLTTYRLQTDSISNEAAAITLHHQIGADVRGLVVRDSGKEPRDLPAKPSIKSLVQKHKREQKKLTDRSSRS